MDRFKTVRSLHELLQRAITTGINYRDPTEYHESVSSIKEEPDLWNLLPDWIHDGADLKSVVDFLRARFPEIKARKEHVSTRFGPIYEFIGHLENSASHPAFIVSPETFLSRVYKVLKERAAIRAIGVLYTAKRVEWIPTDSMDDGWVVRFHVPYEKVYSRYSEDEWKSVSSEINAAIRTVGSGDHREWIAHTEITATVPANPEWRLDAHGVLTGNRHTTHNQANVRSDNPPHRSADGLFFRSQPEIHVYRALKSMGVVFAPLPVFVQGGKDYRRVEPDFVIVKDHHLTIVEIDGDAFHQENPAEAQERLRLFHLEGADTEHINAADCDTEDKAKNAVKALLARIAKRTGRK